MKGVTDHMEEFETLQIQNTQLREENIRLRSILFAIKLQCAAIHGISDEPYLTVRAFSEQDGHDLTQGELGFLSQLCREHCESHGIQIDFTNIDDRHNARPAFPLHVLELCYLKMRSKK